MLSSGDDAYSIFPMQGKGNSGPPVGAAAAGARRASRSECKNPVMLGGAFTIASKTASREDSCQRGEKTEHFAPLLRDGCRAETWVPSAVSALDRLPHRSVVGDQRVLDNVRGVVPRAKSVRLRPCERAAQRSDRFSKMAEAPETPLFDRASRVGFVGLLLEPIGSWRVMREASPSSASCLMYSDHHWRAEFNE